MSDGGRRDLLSIGVFLIIVVVSILLYQPLQVIKDWTLILPFMLLLSGCWFVVLAGMQKSSPQKYALGPLTTLSWGLLLAAFGGAWFLYSYVWYYSIAIIFVVLAVVAIAAAMKRK